MATKEGFVLVKADKGKEVIEVEKTYLVTATFTLLALVVIN